jgi:hypothetical protein
MELLEILPQSFLIVAFARKFYSYLIVVLKVQLFLKVQDNQEKILNIVHISLIVLSQFSVSLPLFLPFKHLWSLLFFSLIYVLLLLT